MEKRNLFIALGLFLLVVIAIYFLVLHEKIPPPSYLLKKEGMVLIETEPLLHFINEKPDTLLEDSTCLIVKTLVGLAVDTQDEITERFGKSSCARDWNKGIAVDIYNVREIRITYKTKDTPENTPKCNIEDYIDTKNDAQFFYTDSLSIYYSTKKIDMSNKINYVGINERSCTGKPTDFRFEFHYSMECFEFSFFTRSQITPYIKNDSNYIGISACRMDYGTAWEPKNKHFTLKINPILKNFCDTTKPKDNFIAENKTPFVTAAPFQDGTPCPPTWEQRVEDKQTFLGAITEALEKEKEKEKKPWTMIK